MKIFGVMLLGAAVALAGLAPAQAQAPNINLIPEVKTKTPEEKEADAVKDKAYRESLRKIPNAKASDDPWGNMRSADTPKADAPKAASRAKPKTRTGSTAN